MLQEFVLANCRVFTVFEDSEYSLKWVLFIDAGVMLALRFQGMTIYVFVCIFFLGVEDFHGLTYV